MALVPIARELDDTTVSPLGLDDSYEEVMYEPSPVPDRPRRGGRRGGECEHSAEARSVGPTGTAEIQYAEVLSADLRRPFGGVPVRTGHRVQRP